MMRYFLILLSVASAFNWINLAQAQNTSNSSSDDYALPFMPDTSALNSNLASSPPAPMTCPDTTDLVRNPTTLKWEGKDPKRWQGYELSFETQIAYFAGAQWHGTKIGQIFCVYRSPVKTSFPILVLFHAEVNEPQGGKWGKNLGDYRNCVSQKQSECAFTPAPAPPKTNPYQLLQQMKDGEDPGEQELGY